MEVTNSTYHQPVMLAECIEALHIKPEGVYVDVTFGGGGHAQNILSKLSAKGKLYGFDQDKDALANAERLKSDNFQFIQANFASLKQYLTFYNEQGVDGILADLGVSSHQFDAKERGFTFRENAPLDMRMNANQPLSAFQIVNGYSQEELTDILRNYGELPFPKAIANQIIRARSEQEISTTYQLKNAVISSATRGKENQFLAQIFQAIRIEVNKELEILKIFLEQAAEMLNPNGRLVVMSYHSLEDRLVKNFIQKGKFSGEVEKDLFGNEIKPLRAINRKPIVASEQEIAQNNRARSAKLRIAEKIVLKKNNKKT